MKLFQLSFSKYFEESISDFANLSNGVVEFSFFRDAHITNVKDPHYLFPYKRLTYNHQGWTTGKSRGINPHMHKMGPRGPKLILQCDVSF